MAVKSSKLETTEAKKATGRIRKRTLFTIIAIVNIIAYTVAVFIMNGFGKTVPSELTVGGYSAGTVELGLLFGIKITEK